MRIIEQSQVPRIGIDKTFRHSRVAPAVTLVVLIGATGWWTVAFALGEDASWHHWLPVGLGVLMILAAAWAVSAAMRSANWFMHVAGDGVFIKFRSYLNSKYPDDAPTVVHIPFDEIAFVRSARRTVTVPESDRSNETDTVRFFEIGLRHSATQELAAALAHERGLPPIPNGAAKHHDYPLRVVEPNLLRIVWKLSGGTDAAKDAIGAHSVATEDTVVYPEWRWESMTDEEKDILLVELSEFGVRKAAKRLSARHLGVDSADAERHVDELMNRSE